MQLKIKILVLLLCVSIITSCQSQPSPEIKTLEVKQFSDKLNQTQNPQLLDVRTPEEYSVEHINNAVNNNILVADLASKTQTLDKTKPVFVYCKSGSRSSKAAEKLVNLGFKTVYNLDGGIMKWNSNGMATPSSKIIGICSQEYNELLKTNKRLIINFYAKWCEPCKKMEPYLLKLKQELNGKINLIRLDADQNKTILEELKFDGLPVIIIYENQKEVYRHTGYLSEEELRKQL